MNIPNVSNRSKHIQAICKYTIPFGFTPSKEEEVSILASICRHETFCIYIDRNGIEKQIISTPSTRITQLIGMHLKRGSVLLFVGGVFREIRRENIRKFQRYFAPPQTLHSLFEEPKYIETQRDKYFTDALPETPYKKLSKRGFSRTITSHRKLEALHYYNKHDATILTAY